MHIIRLEAQNIQRLSAVTIEPGADSPAVVLAGANEEGKSSVLESIEMALAGERVMPPEPIRRGQDKAHVILDLGDMIVTRRFTAKGSSLTVTNKEGLRYPSPQALLDGLYNKLTFDPLAFANTKGDEQARILRTLAGLDTSDIEVQRRQAFEKRTEINRDVARVKGALDRAPRYDDVGTTIDDGAALIAALADADRLAENAGAAKHNSTRAGSDVSAAKTRVAQASVALDEARAAVRLAEHGLEDATRALTEATKRFETTVTAAQQAVDAVPDRAALRDQLAALQQRNQQVDANVRRAELATELEHLQGEADALTKDIARFDTEKGQRLSEAKFPVEGLGITDAGVTWNGIPFEQASTAIRTRVSAAIGFALNPKLRILLVRNGNDLDGKNLQLLAEAAKDAGGQVWVERIAGGDGLQTVVIEDGAVKGAAPIEMNAVADAETPTRGDEVTLPSTGSKGPRRRSAAGLFEEGAAK